MAAACAQQRSSVGIVERFAGIRSRRPAYDQRVPGPIQSIERAAAVIRLLASRPVQLGLSDISTSLQLPKGTAHGILRTLVQVGFVDQDRTTGRYRVGAGLTAVGPHFLDVNEIRARSLNWADPLAARTGESVRVGVLVDDEVLIVHHVFRPDDSPQTVDIGAVLPAHACALGKVLLAYDPHAEQSLPAELDRYTARTVHQRRELMAALAETRAHGYASEIGELTPDEASIAAPILGFGGLVVAAIAISGSADRLCDTRGRARAALVTLVSECARSIGRDLGESRSAR
jgi:DNA-binding IclR family transcriptional regulator